MSLSAEEVSFAAILKNSAENIAKTQRDTYYFPMEKNNPGTELRMARVNRSLSLAEVASKTGLTNSIISRIENGKVKEPSPTAIRELCSLYGIPVTRMYVLYGWLSACDETNRVLFDNANELDSRDVAFIQQAIDYLVEMKRGRKNDF